MRLIASLLVTTAIATPAVAQDSAWRHKAIVYAWVPGFDTSFETERFGTIEGNKTSNDVLGDLNFAFMGLIEAQKGRFSLIGDLLYSSISMDADRPRGVVYDESVIKTNVTALSGYGMYRITTDPRLALDLGGGFRAFSVDTTASLLGGNRETISIGGDASWVDPLAAARLIVAFNEKWSGTLFADFGGAGSSETWQGIASVNYALNDHWTMNAGYRTMSIEKDIGNIPTTVELSGPLIGFSYNF